MDMKGLKLSDFRTIFPFTLARIKARKRYPKLIAINKVNAINQIVVKK